MGVLIAICLYVRSVMMGAAQEASMTGSQIVRVIHSYFNFVRQTGLEDERRFLQSLRRLQRLANRSANDMARFNQGLAQVNQLWNTTSTQVVALLDVIYGTVPQGDATTSSSSGEASGASTGQTSEEGDLTGGDNRFPTSFAAKCCALSYKMLEGSRSENLMAIQKELTGGWQVQPKHSDKNMTTFVNNRLVVIAHRGTDTTGRRTKRDLSSDIAPAFGKQATNKEFNSRLFKTIDIVKAYHDGFAIFLTGHSLGGSTVIYALEGSKLVRDKVEFTRTFNAGATIFSRGLDHATKNYLKGRVRHHRLSTDIISAGFSLKVPFGKIKTIASNLNPVEAHKLTHWF